MTWKVRLHLKQSKTKLLSLLLTFYTIHCHEELQFFLTHQQSYPHLLEIWFPLSFTHVNTDTHPAVISAVFLL